MRTIDVVSYLSANHILTPNSEFVVLAAVLQIQCVMRLRITLDYMMIAHLLSKMMRMSIVCVKF